LQLFNVATIANNTAIYLPRGNTTEKSFFGNVIVHFGSGTEVSAGLRNVNFKSRAAGLYISCTPTPRFFQMPFRLHDFFLRMP
jgi:hypothetical protein